MSTDATTTLPESVGQEVPAKPNAGNASRLDYGFTYFVNVVLVGLGVMTLRLANQHFGELGFSEYVLARRVVSFLAPAMALGLGVVLPRNVGRVYGTDSKDQASAYVVASLVLLLVPLLAYCVASLIWLPQMAAVLFGSNEYTALVTALIPLLGGMALHVCCYGYLRGRLRIRACGSLDVVSLGVIPISVLCVVSEVVTAYVWIGGLMVFTELVVLLGALRWDGPIQFDVLRPIRQLLATGLPRIPGDIAYYGMFLLPAVVMLHVVGMREAGWVAYATSLLGLMQQIVAPLSIILLPETASLLKMGRVHELRQRVIRLVGVSMFFTVMGVSVFEIGATYLITLHLGSASMGLVSAARGMMLAAVPLNLFVGVRSIVDAGRDRALVPWFCCVAMVAFCLTALGLAFFVSATSAVIVAVNLSLVVLAALTSVSAWKVLHRTETSG